MNVKVAAVILVAVLAAGSAAAVYFCKSSDDAGETVEDALGRMVSVPSETEKIVCLSAGSVRLACYLGAFGMIAGVDSQDAGSLGSPANYGKATYRLAYDVRSLPNVGSEDNVKGIIETGADIVVTSKTDASAADSLQQKLGIPVLAISAAGNIDADDPEFDSNLRIMGKAIGKSDRAEELIKAKNSVLADLADYKNRSEASSRCYVGGMFYMMQGGMLKTTGNYAPFDYTPAKNIMPDVNGGNPYDTLAKEIADANPEFIFFDPMTLQDTKDAFLKDRDILETADAVKNGDMYSTFVFKYYGTNWEAELINAYFVGSVIDPGTYSFDLAEKANAVLKVFYPDSDLDFDALKEAQSPGPAKLDW